MGVILICHNQILEAQAPSYSQKVVCSKEFQNFQISYSRVIATYRTVLEDCVIYHKSLNYEQLLSDTKELYYSCKTSLELFNFQISCKAPAKVSVSNSSGENFNQRPSLRLIRETFSEKSSSLPSREK